MSLNHPVLAGSSLAAPFRTAFLSRVSLTLLALASFNAALGVSVSGCASPEETSWSPEEPSAFLWKKYSGGTGIDGYASPEDLDDATAYYARAAADLSGVPGEAGPGVVPVTLEDFKIQFNIPTQDQGESVEEYRDRVGASVYFNSNELGLGRELVCSAAIPEAGDMPGFVDSDGVSVGVGCYVTNYAGDGAFYDLEGAMENATSESPHPKNTVAITFRPTRPEGEQVQFWVYGEGGKIQNWAQLDSREGLSDTDQMRPVPSVCTECHGGNYTQGSGVAKGAHFLPVNPVAVNLAFSPDDIGDRMRAANCVAWISTSMTPLQKTWLKAVYGEEGPCQSSTERSVAPSGWENDEDLWKTAALPYCGSCHLAMPEMKLMESAEVFRATNLRFDVCGSDSSAPLMPHALPTFRALWAGNPSAGQLLMESHPSLVECE